MPRTSQHPTRRDVPAARTVLPPPIEPAPQDEIVDDTSPTQPCEYPQFANLHFSVSPRR